MKKSNFLVSAIGWPACQLFIASVALLFLSSGFGCSDEDDRPERVDKLRAIVVTNDNPAYVYNDENGGAVANLEFILVSPSADPVVATPTALDEARLSLTQVSVAASEQKAR